MEGIDNRRSSEVTVPYIHEHKALGRLWDEVLIDTAYDQIYSTALSNRLYASALRRSLRAQASLCERKDREWYIYVSMDDLCQRAGKQISVALSRLQYFSNVTLVGSTRSSGQQSIENPKSDTGRPPSDLSGCRIEAMTGDQQGDFLISGGIRASLLSILQRSKVLSSPPKSDTSIPAEGWMNFPRA